MAVIDSNNFITHLIWSGLVDKATCGELKRVIKLCTVKGIYTKDDIITILTELYTEIDAMSNSVVEGRSVTITSWEGMQKRIVKLIQSKIDQIKATTKNDLAVSSELENKENVSPIIDWNNCHTSEQLESISATKNDLAVEKIVDVLGSYTDLDIPYKHKIAEDILNNLPSVTPQELIHGKCNQCKYYEGVHNAQGHAPCMYHQIGGVMWNWYCSQFKSEVKE